MAQRKSPSSPANKPGGKPTDRTAAKAAAGRPGSKAGGKGGPGGRPPARKPGKSIVNQRQTPWGLIITAVVLVLFAGAVVTYAVTRNSGSGGNGDVSAADKRYALPELAAAKAISGIIYKVELNHDHVSGTVKYDTSPPTGGDHSPIWADCNGVVYDHQIANENAVHMLEHGAIWITYNPKTIKASDLTVLKNKVSGVDRMALTPYAGLKTPISLQAWNYQLFLNSATDKRVDEFIDALRYNQNTTPEIGASCTGAGFVAKDSYPGHPYEG